jgi:hypothetical protein
MPLSELDNFGLYKRGHVQKVFEILCKASGAWKAMHKQMRYNAKRYLT